MVRVLPPAGDWIALLSRCVPRRRHLVGNAPPRCSGPAEIRGGGAQSDRTQLRGVECCLPEQSRIRNAYSDTSTFLIAHCGSTANQEGSRRRVFNLVQLAHSKLEVEGAVGGLTGADATLVVTESGTIQAVHVAIRAPLGCTTVFGCTSFGCTELTVPVYFLFLDEYDCVQDWFRYSVARNLRSVLSEVASMGASAALVFTARAAPFAQPRNARELRIAVCDLCLWLVHRVKTY